jgi:hypothetical protein
VSTVTPAGAGNWPAGRLTGQAAVTVNGSEFLPEMQLRQWHEELDAMGLRSTGSPVHEQYIDELISRLERAGVTDVHGEPVPVSRWTAGRWSLDAGGKPIATSSYIPYSGSTPPGGVTGALARVPPGAIPQAGALAGKIAVFDVPLPATAYSVMAQISYAGWDPQGLIDPTARYARPWAGIGDLISLLDSLPAAGAIGCVGVIDLPPEAARGSYFPYDGHVRTVPGVYVDRTARPRLEALIATGAPARLTLAATAERFVSRNVVGLIPGRTDELVILNSHTDGTNAVEDNGPNAIVAMAQYLSRLDRDLLPRSVMVSLTTGHFHGGIGQVTFAREHLDGALRKAACALTIEHLGALEWAEIAGGQMALTGRPELGVIFVPENEAMVGASLAALKRAGDGPGQVLRPFVPAPGSPSGYGWPGEGTQLWTDGQVMTMNYIAGPTYLLNWGIPTLDKCDIGRMRREAISLTEMVLETGSAPLALLGSLDMPPLA